jgi:hypothetical protein
MQAQVDHSSQSEEIFHVDITQQAYHDEEVNPTPTHEGRMVVHQEMFGVHSQQSQLLCGLDVMVITSNKFNEGAPAFIREAEAPRHEPSRVMRRHPGSNTLSRASIARTMSLVALRLTQVAQPSGRPALRRRESPELALGHSPRAAAEGFEDETVARKRS